MTCHMYVQGEFAILPEDFDMLYILIIFLTSWQTISWRFVTEQVETGTFSTRIPSSLHTQKTCFTVMTILPLSSDTCKTTFLYNIRRTTLSSISLYYIDEIDIWGMHSVYSKNIWMKLSMSMTLPKHDMPYVCARYTIYPQCILCMNRVTHTVRFILNTQNALQVIKHFQIIHILSKYMIKKTKNKKTKQKNKKKRSMIIIIHVCCKCLLYIDLNGKLRVV
jgi:hypothetical protein